MVVVSVILGERRKGHAEVCSAHGGAGWGRLTQKRVGIYRWKALADVKR